jgi:hypothetical protein
MTKTQKCQHCQWIIVYVNGTGWRHVASGSVWCDESGVVRAQP